MKIKVVVTNGIEILFETLYHFQDCPEPFIKEMFDNGADVVMVSTGGRSTTYRLVTTTNVVGDY